MRSVKSQLICVCLVIICLVSLVPRPTQAQITKKKNFLMKGLMGAGLLKLLKPKKGLMPIPLPLPLPLPVEWQQQSGLLSQNKQPVHVQHQYQYPQQPIQLSPIDYSEYQSAISQSYGPAASGFIGNQISAYGSGQNGQQNNYGSNDGIGNYGNSYGSNDDNLNSAYNQANNGGYGVAGVPQNDNYNAYTVSNSNLGNNGQNQNGNSADNGQNNYASASSISSNYNPKYNNNNNYNSNYNSNYNGNYNSQSSYNNGPSYSQYSAPDNYGSNYQENNGYRDNGSNGHNAPYEDNQGNNSNGYASASSNNYAVAARNNYQPSSYTSSNGWVAMD